MREYVFCGKRIDTGEWVFGDLVHSMYHKNDTCIKGPDGVFDVIPETVGQYTGLEDRNGRRIFEGDIVWHYIEAQLKDGDPEKYEAGLVRWNERFNSWERTTPRPELFPYDFVRLGKSCVYDVVGNIHDNPELLN